MSIFREDADTRPPFFSHKINKHKALVEELLIAHFSQTFYFVDAGVGAAGGVVSATAVRNDHTSPVTVSLLVTVSIRQ